MHLAKRLHLTGNSGMYKKIDLKMTCYKHWYNLRHPDHFVHSNSEIGVKD